jgi:hypothetical protein
MAIKIPSEYNDAFDFGFTAVESEESIVEKQVVNTAPMIDGLSAVEDKVSIILNKIDYLEEIIKAGAGSNNNFDIDSYKQLVEKDVNVKLKKLEGLIMPLLANLLKNPDKDYIKWPNRKPIIEAQIAKILEITRPLSE